MEGTSSSGDRQFLEVTLDLSDENVILRSISPLEEEESQQTGKITLSKLLRYHSSRSIRLSTQLSSSSSLDFGSGSASRRSLASKVPNFDRDRLITSSDHHDSASLVRSRSGAENALRGLRFISRTIENEDRQKELWKSVESRFWKLASPDGMLDRADFGLCIGMPDTKEFARELFDALARRKHQSLQCISKDELYDFWLQLSDQSFDSRIQMFFDMCDKDADGRISEEEVKEVIMLSASANKLSKLSDQAEEYAALIMEELDPHGAGYIELWQLETLMLGHIASLSHDGNTSQNWSQALSYSLEGKINAALWLKYFLLENWQRVWVLSVWLFAMCALFLWKFYSYKHTPAFRLMGYCLCTAKGAAETLKLNMGLVLLPVCRNTITWLRSTRLGSIFSFDDNLNFHKLVAGAILVGILIHATVHLACDFPKLTTAPEDLFMASVGRGFHFNQPSYAELVLSVEGVTGITMVVMMLVAFILATRWFRRNIVRLPGPFHRLTGFNAFWYSHHIFLIVYVLLLVHSICLFLTQQWSDKSTWMYLAVPVVLYSAERFLSAFRAGHFPVQVVKAAVHSGNVLALQMTKPPSFRYKSGMYIFLKCVSISQFEWHPFSITSAPSDEYLSVHIRTVGDWTTELKRQFSEVLDGHSAERIVMENEDLEISGAKSGFPRLLIDGPYGAPAQAYDKYDVLLLVGLGIGATPFISILKEMLNRIKLADQDLSEQLGSPKKRSRRLQCPTNAYFYWITREQGSFEWFKGVMNEVAESDHKAVIEMHNYLTSVYAEGDARSTLITMMQALHHSKNGVDIVSGTRVRTHFARPKWRKVFARLANIHKNSRIGVFYCGTRVLAKELDALSREFNQMSTAKFHFHKENF